MWQTETKKSPRFDRRKKRKTPSLEKLAATDYQWIVPLVSKVGFHASILAKFFSYVLADIAKHPFHSHGFFSGRLAAVQGVVGALFPQTRHVLSQLEKAFGEITLSIGETSASFLADAELTEELLVPVIENLCSLLEKNPQFIVLLRYPALLEEAFGPLGERLAALVSFIPALSSKAAEKFPDLKETFFHSLFKLEKKEREKIYLLSEEIIGEVYEEKVFPILKQSLASDPRGKVLAPILLGAIESIPGESCINALLAIACTPQHEFSNGRVIAIAIQELGGLYIKISQVISELCPPSLARELRAHQDDAGGLFPSVEKSWEYLTEVFSRPDFLEWKELLVFPKVPARHFASASVGALYDFLLTPLGQQKFGVERVLVKVQRPNLKETFATQSKHILKLTESARCAVEQDETLKGEVQNELLGIISTLRRAIINYHKQSEDELDFTTEKINAERVRLALGSHDSVCIPRFFRASSTVIFMEKMSGTKVTKIIHTKYLERRKIADTIAETYIDLIFRQGIVWADPHPGNILYDDMTHQVAMIDLNPCFIWDIKTRQEFKHLIYKLLLRDLQGVHKALYYLVVQPENLDSKKLRADLLSFLEMSFANASLTRFVGEFIKTLNENKVELKIEVQAALRGLSQLALTTSSISVRNSFGSILRKQFTFKELLGTIWEIGFIRVGRVVLSTLFEFTRQMPRPDVGPVLDERDIRKVRLRTVELAKASVCRIVLHRVSPEDHPNLRMSQDGQCLIVTSDLHVRIVDTTRPATVCYVVEIPERKWLKERQEFIKLSSFARSFCTIECLEQMRRNSLDDYWRTVEAWNKAPRLRTLRETELIGEVTIAGRQLYSLRFASLWNSSQAGLTISSRIAWRLLLKVEVWKERSQQNYILAQEKKVGDVLIAHVAYSSFFRVKTLLLEGFLFCIKKYISNLKFSMHLLPLSTKELENLLLFGLSRNF